MPIANSAAMSQGQLRRTTAPTEVEVVDGAFVVIWTGALLVGCTCAICSAPVGVAIGASVGLGTTPESGEASGDAEASGVGCVLAAMMLLAFASGVRRASGVGCVLAFVGGFVIPASSIEVRFAGVGEGVGFALADVVLLDASFGALNCTSRRLKR